MRLCCNLYLLKQVIDKSKQWWKVKKSRGEEGHVPHNVLEPADRETPTANHGRGGVRHIFVICKKEFLRESKILKKKIAFNLSSIAVKGILGCGNKNK